MKFWLSFLLVAAPLFQGAVADPSTKSSVTSPDGRFEAVWNFQGIPPFKITEKASGKLLLIMDDERVGNRGLDASWAPDNKTVVVVVVWRLGVQIQVCRKVGERFERNEGPAPPEEFLRIARWSGPNSLKMRGEKKIHTLTLSANSASFGEEKAVSVTSESFKKERGFHPTTNR